MADEERVRQVVREAFATVSNLSGASIDMPTDASVEDAAKAWATKP